MRIAAAESIRLAIPFSDGGRGEGMTPSTWNQLDTVLVRLESDTGLVGWGEAFAYFCAGAVKAMLDETVLPLLIGCEASDPASISDMLQRKLNLFGRYGITIFALSGVDIALWDMKGKREGVPISTLLGGRRRDAIPAYASLVRYGHAETAARFTRKALKDGYRHIKLHEVARSEIAACHAELGGASLMVDVNCTWRTEEAASMAGWLGDLGALWLEEPTFPPEDFEQLRQLRSPIPLSCGENLCTAWQFEALLAAGVVRYPQPSVTKVGGLSEVARIIELADKRDDVVIMPHSPYFGPGYLATLHICAALRKEPLFEYLYVWPESQIYDGLPEPKDGLIQPPRGPGLGLEPNIDIVRRYRIE
ncbi:mandelate racemase/muconate lactonizing enzyme family protein (plasmid) [Bosea sp. F3-2]|uniref:mandelate racemase/muconate lactonizing enzyme family protein n=1 Tax=Bosea sp. F3-2 TaxID=2599640 RepID=UPI0011EF5A8F|nr:mandelate racemase/muconate lactonizing enzyme family protein [Bosea sp. F3-2]QEL27298.1 mandelate racemase/muconate lactonizing enzyme family protein [Bosea sp. F3-2]